MVTTLKIKTRGTTVYKRGCTPGNPCDELNYYIERSYRNRGLELEPATSFDGKFIGDRPALRLKQGNYVWLTYCPFCGRKIEPSKPETLRFVDDETVYNIEYVDSLDEIEDDYKG